MVVTLKNPFKNRGVKPDDSNDGSNAESSAANGSITEEKYGLFHLVSDVNDNHNIDIVAVHGLNGHWAKTWTDTSDNQESFWLRDFLPSQLQEETGICARVMSFGYDSKTAFSKNVSDIEDQAGALLHALDVERDSPSQMKRPIIFVAHSLGGIIVKKALIIAHERSSQYGSLLKSVSAMVLFGVPHRGSDMAYWARLAANVLNASQLGANPNFVESLQKHSRTFSDISQQFIERAADLKKIYSFYEIKKLYNTLVVDKDSARLGLHNEIPVAISANHRDICKFSGADSQKYTPVWKSIRRLCVESIGEQTSYQPTTQFTLPFDQDDHFVGREDIIEEISLKFKTQKRVALNGIGGVGKSQIAIEYCYRFRKAHPQTHVFWIHVGSVARFNQAYASIARKCKIPGRDAPGANVVQLVYEWLTEERNGSWLMVLDNADDKSVFSNQIPENASQKVDRNDDVLNLLSYLPQTSNGQILVTSRNREATSQLINSTWNIIDVPLIDADLAVSLLSKKLPKDQWDRDLALELVHMLDRLPLAITQASAFITTKYSSLSDYKRYLSENTTILFHNMGDIRRDPAMEHSVMLTWYISFNQIRKEDGLAAAVLSLMSVLDRQHIPRFLLRGGSFSDLDFDNAIALLLNFSLISQDKKREAFGMHRLVQIATRTWLEKRNEKALWESTAVALLANVFPSGKYETWETCASLLPHTNVVAEYQYESSEDESQLANVLEARAWYLLRIERINLAEQDAQRVLDLRLRLHERDSVSVSNAMSVKAAAFIRRADYITAEGLLRESLRILQKVGGDEYLTETITLNLGICLNNQDKHEEAKNIFQQVYESRGTRLGKRHTGTLVVMGHLAKTLRYQKRFDEAEGLCQQRLDILRAMITQIQSSAWVL